MNDQIKVIAEFIDNASAGIKRTTEVLREFYGGFTDGVREELAAVDANRELAASARAAEPAVQSLGKTILQLGAALLAANQLIDGFVMSLQAADKMSDLSDKTGIAASSLRGLGYAAEQSGGTLDGLVGALDRLGRSATMSEEDVKKQADSFKQLGISATTMNGQIKDTETLFSEVADAFQGIEDGPEKAALAYRLFGSEAKNLLPLLNSGAAGIKALADETAELGGMSAAEFDKFAAASGRLFDGIATLQFVFGGLFDQLNAELTPVLNVIIDQLIDSAKEGGLLRDVINGLAFSFKEGLVPGIKLAAITLDGFTSVIKIAAKGLGAIGAAMVAILSGNFRQAGAIMSAYKDDVDEIAASHTNFQQKLALAGHEAVVLADSVSKPRRQIKALGKETKEVTSELEKMLSALKITNQSFGMDESQKQRLEAQAKYYVDLKVLGEKRASALYAEVDAQITLNKALRDGKEAQDAYTKAMTSIEVMQAANAEIAFEITLVGKSSDERKRAIELRKEEIKLQQIQKGLTAENASRIAEEGAAALSARENLIRAREDAVITNEILDGSYDTILADVQRRLILATSLLESGKIVTDDYTKYVEKQLARLKDTTKSELSEMQEFWKSASEGIQQNLQSSIFDFMQGKLSSLGDAVKNTIDGIVSQILAAKLATALFGADTAKGNVGGFVGQGISFLSGMFGGARANGGPVEAGKAYLVGERGPEPFIPRTNGTILPNSVMQGGGSNFNISVSAIDSKDFLAKMAEVKRDVVEMLGHTQRSYRMNGA